MSIHDRDWYRDEMRKKGGYGSRPRHLSDAPRKAQYDPRQFRRSTTSPPEPHEWPTWVVVLAVLLAFVVSVVLAKRYLEGKPLIPRSSSAQTIQLPPCHSVQSGPCFK